MEVRERRVGAWGKGRAGALSPHLHPPRIPQLRGSLDEGAHLLRQSETHQQVQRQRTDHAEFAAQVRTQGAPGEGRHGGEVGEDVSVPGNAVHRGHGVPERGRDQAQNSV